MLKVVKHHLFNVVTAPEGVAHAVLIRGVEPIENVNVMLQRRNFSKLKYNLTAGPGTLTKALGISTNDNGKNLTDKKRLTNYVLSLSYITCI